MRRRRVLARLALPALVGVAFYAGLSADHAASAARRGPASAPYRALDVFADVLAHVENSYVDERDERELVYGAIEGLMARLDPYSTFMRPDVYRQMRDETTGEFEGLGIEVASEEGVVTVVAPLADSPGARAGLRAGDRLLSIDGVPTRDLTLAEVVRRMKGPAGTKAVLGIMREGFAASLSLTLVRERVRMQSVEMRLLDAERRYAYVRIRAFQERTERNLRKALDEARAAAGGPLRGLVLDLRDNPGGLVDQAVRVADAFLASGVIVTTAGRGGASVEVERARERDTEPGYPLVVLVNKGSASASEIVAGALQDHGRAVLVGGTTFGKGSVQTVIELPDGSGLKLTVARYYTPKKRSIQELGIAPDRVIADAPGPSADDRPAERDPKVRLEGETLPASTRAVTPPRDRALEAALDHLRSVDILKPGTEPPRDVAARKKE